MLLEFNLSLSELQRLPFSQCPKQLAAQQNCSPSAVSIAHRKKTRRDVFLSSVIPTQRGCLSRQAVCHLSTWRFSGLRTGQHTRSVYVDLVPALELPVDRPRPFCSMLSTQKKSFRGKAEVLFVINSPHHRYERISLQSEILDNTARKRQQFHLSAVLLRCKPRRRASPTAPLFSLSLLAAASYRSAFSRIYLGVLPRKRGCRCGAYSPKNVVGDTLQMLSSLTAVEI